MTRIATRTKFHSSRLIRTLAELAVLEPVASTGNFAERLSLWIDFSDAIALCSVHNAGNADTSALPSASPPQECKSVEEYLSKTRLTLERAITVGGIPNGAGTRPQLPTLTPGTSIEDAIAFEPYRRYHLAQQRDMELNIRPLRVRVRSVVGTASPRLRQLVALDASMDTILCERESHLLSSIPSLLKVRFLQLLTAYQHARANHQPVDSPHEWVQPGGWLARFRTELQTVLLAELDLRLQPTVGLLEAFHNEKTQPL